MATLSIRQCMINDDGEKPLGGNMQGVYYAVDYELHIGTVGSITGSAGDRGGTSVDGNRGCERLMPRESPSDGQDAVRRSLDDPAIVRKRVLAIIAHNTGGSQPSAARVTSVVSIAARADFDVATVRSVLDELVAEGGIERHTTATGETRVALASDR